MERKRKVIPLGCNELTKEEFLERISAIKMAFDSGNRDKCNLQIQRLDKDTNTGDWIWYWCSVLNFGTKYKDGDVYLSNGQDIRVRTSEDLWNAIHNNPDAWRRWPK